MTKIAVRSLLALLCVAFLLTSLTAKPALGQSKDAKSKKTQSKDAQSEETKTPPIELSEIKLQYAVKDNSGGLSWESPNPTTPNVIPATAEKLRFTAKVTNRPAGSRIIMKAALQELCPSTNSGMSFLARLRHLTENEKEFQVVNPDQPVSIELEVHCEDCVPAACGCACSGKDHLGEGPHLTTLTVTDTTTGKNTVRAKPASYRMDIKTECPEKCEKPDSK
jgi:hypothetical protein